MENNKIKYLMVGLISTIMIAIIGVTYASWKGQIIGSGSNMSVTLDKVYIQFTDSTEIAETGVRPGWSTSKTFTVENQGSTDFKYDIYIKDLINTLATEGYFQYKITSNNNGYNMEDYELVAKSPETSDFDLGTGITIGAGVTQEYTIEFRYLDDPDVDQSEDMGKRFGGQLMIRENDKTKLSSNTLYAILTNGKKYKIVKTAIERGSFNIPYNGTGVTQEAGSLATIFKESGTSGRTENNKDVYYFAGNPQDNWVKFAGFYWRIIRTNEDGSVRLLYAGTSHDGQDGYINGKLYTYKKDNTNTDHNARYVGWVYGKDSTTLETNRNGSPLEEGIVKKTLDEWYENIIETNYGTYVSNSAIYCNDRSGGYYSTTKGMYFAAYNRIERNTGGSGGKDNQPSFRCGYSTGISRNSTQGWGESNTNEENMYVDASEYDKFSKAKGNLKNPVGLITADELSYAGGVVSYSNTAAPNVYYYRNSKTLGCTGKKDDLCSVTGNNEWWTMTPKESDSSNRTHFIFSVIGSAGTAGIIGSKYPYQEAAIRPVLSLKSCVIVTQGNGTAENPYEVTVDDTCALADN